MSEFTYTQYDLEAHAGKQGISIEDAERYYERLGVKPSEEPTMTLEQEKDYRLDAHWPGRGAMVEREQKFIAALDDALAVLVDVGCFNDYDRIKALKQDALDHRSAMKEKA